MAFILLSFFSKHREVQKCIHDPSNATILKWVLLYFKISTFISTFMPMKKIQTLLQGNLEEVIQNKPVGRSMRLRIKYFCYSHIIELEHQ